MTHLTAATSDGDTRETREFARETKFLVRPDDADRLRAWARTWLPPDPHGAGPKGDEYRTATLYFETEGLDVFHRRGSFGRSKFRIRRYGAADVIFLERKLRTDGVVVKRRTRLPIVDLDRLTAEPDRAWPGHWFHKRLVKRALRPTCDVSYRRLARVGMTASGPIRLTIDDQLSAQPVSDIRVGSSVSAMPVLDGELILELKYFGGMPAMFRRIVERLGLEPAPVSKYRLSLASLGRAGAHATPADALVSRGESR